MPIITVIIACALLFDKLGQAVLGSKQLEF